MTKLVIGPTSIDLIQRAAHERGVGPTPTNRYRHAMDWVLFWSVVGAIGGIGVATLVGVLTFRRQFPKRRVEWWVESRRLIAATGQIKNLEIKVEGLDVDDPYLNTLSLYSNSRADIPSSAFDAGQRIRVKITKGGALQLAPDEDLGIKIAGGHGEGFEWAEFGLDPQLIRKRAEGRLVFVSSGPPSVEVEFPLIDIETRRLTPSQVHARQPYARRARRRFWLMIAAFPLIIFLAWAVPNLIRVLLGN